MSKGIIVNKYGTLDKSSISDYVESKLVGNDTQGTSEAAASNADRAQVGLAKLCQILTDKRLLSANDIITITNQYEQECGLVDIKS